jgi:hypothetical protein
VFSEIAKSCRIRSSPLLKGPDARFHPRVAEIPRPVWRCASRSRSSCVVRQRARVGRSLRMLGRCHCGGGRENATTAARHDPIESVNHVKLIWRDANDASSKTPRGQSAERSRHSPNQGVRPQPRAPIHTVRAAAQSRPDPAGGGRHGLPSQTAESSCATSAATRRIFGSGSVVLRVRKAATMRCRSAAVTGCSPVT